MRTLTRGADPRKAGPIATTLFGRTRRQVLGLLFGHPDEEFYVRDIARRTQTPVGALQRELTALVDAGILERELKGRQLYYRADRRCPVFDELRALVTKTSGLVDVLRLGLFGLQHRVDAAFVFGSVARMQEKSGSDVDLFVLGNVSLGDLVDALAESQATLGREINPVVQSPEEFAARIAKRDHFVSRVLSEPRLFVIGDEDVLERLGEKRLDRGTREKPSGDRVAARARRAGSPRQPVARRQR